MTVNYETKSHLARLLAQEDLVVQNKNVETASFNVETRVLTLPMWKKASNQVYDMLVSHETAHALYTPNEDWQKKADIPHSYLNVTEDARIEKLMKRRYGGMTKTFYRGYQQLSEIDFFDLEGVDIDGMNFADRANLHFKIGNFVDIPIKNDEEQSILDLMSAAETFDDAIEAAKVLHKYCVKEKEEKEENQELSIPTPENGDGSSEQQQSGTESEDGEQGGDTTESGKKTPDPEGESESGEESHTSAGSDEAPEVETDATLNDKLKELNGNVGSENMYCTIPNVHLDKIVVSNKVLQDMMNQWYSEKSQYDLQDVDATYTDVKRSSAKEVNYMVKEFECKKSADAYSRATTAKTGVLNTSTLHTYKYNDDLFRKVTVIPEGKNHGLVFLLDWSGSMSGIMENTAKQLLNIVWFCSKVNIPFDVYLFTNAYTLTGRDNIYNTSEEEMVIDKELDKLYVGKSFNLLNIITSTGKRSELDKQLKNFWRLVVGVSRYMGIPNHPKLSLGGTPLNEALICLHKILPTFQAKHKTQKTQCVILTDGEASQIPVTRMVKSYSGEEVFGARYADGDSYLTNRKTGHSYKIGYCYSAFTSVLVKDLRQTFPNTNFVGIRLGAPSIIRQMARLYGISDPDVISEANKKKFINIKTSGYNSYFVMNSGTLFNDAEFQVKEDASKSQIKSAFGKSLKSKAMNKKMLSEFMDLVC